MLTQRQKEILDRMEARVSRVRSLFETIGRLRREIEIEQEAFREDTRALHQIRLAHAEREARLDEAEGVEA